MAGSFFEQPAEVKKSNSAPVVTLLGEAIAVNSTAYEAKDDTGKIVW